MIAEQQITAENILPSNWQKQSESSYSTDDLIDAYLKGKSDQKTETQKILFEHLKSNVDKAASVAEKLMTFASAKNIDLSNASLKIVEVTKFIILFVVNEEDYYSDTFREIYVASRHLKNENDSSTFNINFTFTFSSESFDINCVNSDGFFLKHANEPKS